jgi:MFS family permease
MIERDRSRWSIVGVLFVTLFFIYGPLYAGGVFFLPLLKSFGWSRAQLAALGGVGAIAAGASGPFIGWLIDRIGVRAMMIGGAAAIVLCDLALSRANSFAQFAAICIVSGAAGAATRGCESPHGSAARAGRIIPNTPVASMTLNCQAAQASRPLTACWG